MEFPTPEYLKKKRLELNLTQCNLARLANVSQSLIARIELNDVDPRLSTVLKILNVLEDEEKKKYRLAKDILTFPVIYVTSKDKVENAINIMNNYGFSQLPVIDNGLPIGSLSEDIILKTISSKKSLSNLKVSDLMSSSFPIIS